MEKYRTFLAAAAAGSFSGAAERLFLTPSAVSKHMAALEAELETALFTRSPTGVALTEEGERCVPYLQELVAGYDRMRRGLDSQGRRELTLCSIPLQNVMHLPELVGAFQAAHPAVEVALGECHGREMEGALLSGRYELAFSADAYLNRRSLEWMELWQDEIWVALPPGHRLSKERAVDVAALAGERFVFLPQVTGVYDVYAQICMGGGFRPRVVATTEREETTLRYVAQGMGVTFIPRSLGQAMAVRGVVLLPMKRPEVWSMVLAWRRGGRLSSGARAFRAFVGELISSKRWV